MVPLLTGSPCKLTDPVPSSLFSFSAGAPVPQLGTSGGPGRLRSAPRPAVVQARLGLLLPGSRQQIKIKGGGGSREGQRSLCRESEQVSWECLSAVQGGSCMGLEVGE